MDYSNKQNMYYSKKKKEERNQACVLARWGWLHKELYLSLYQKRKRQNVLVTT